METDKINWTGNHISSESMLSSGNPISLSIILLYSLIMKRQMIPEIPAFYYELTWLVARGYIHAFFYYGYSHV